MIRSITDERGTLSWTTEPRWCRAYWITNPNDSTVRGEHAHWKATRLFVCLQGGFALYTENAHGWTEGRLRPGDAIAVPPLEWTRLHSFDPASIVLVLADRPYTEADLVLSKSAWQGLVSELRPMGEEA